jgi:hypothetical protein
MGGVSQKVTNPASAPEKWLFASTKNGITID